MITVPSESEAQGLLPEKAWISSPRFRAAVLRLLRGSEPGRRSGLAKQKALGKVDADLAQFSQRRFKLDVFGYTLDFQPMSDVVHHLDKDSFAAIVLSVPDETPIDFQVVRDQFFKIVER